VLPRHKFNRKRCWIMNEFLQSLVGGTISGLMYAVLGIGFNLIWGVTKVINMAHTGFALIGSYAAIMLLKMAGIDPLVSIVFIIPVLFCMGLALHKFLIKPATQNKTLEVMMSSMVLTYGLFMIIINLLVFLFKNDSKVLAPSYADVSFQLGPVSVGLLGLISLVISLITLAAVYVFLNMTFTGKGARAVWQNQEGAMLSGIDVDAVTSITYGVSLASAGMGGLCLAMIYSVSPYAGIVWMNFTFLVSIIGGLGSVVGTLVGGLIIGIISVTGTMFIHMKFIVTALFTLLILILLVRPQGLFRR
jgi:branched-chain amino acid transport system permease protein